MKYIGRIISFPIGLVLIAVGIIIFVIVNRTIQDEFKKAAVVIPDNGADEIVDPWIRFIGNEGDPNNIRTYTFMAYNLTNPAETMQGALPKYQEVGPYSYNYIYERMNANLYDDDEKLSFKLWKRYYPMVADGFRDPTKDTIYHFNLAYAGAVQNVGGELALSVGLTAAAMGQIIAGLTDSSFKLKVQFVATPKIIGGAFSNLLPAGQPNACQAWANDPSIPFSVKAITGNSSTVDASQCLALFTQSNKFSLTDPTIPGVYALSPNTVKTALLATPYGLTSEQADLIIKYQQGMATNFVPNYLVSSFPECAVPTTCSNNPLYFGLLQWAKYPSLLNQSVFDIPGSGVPAVPEFGMYTMSNLTLAKAGSLFLNTSAINLITPTSIGTILTLGQKLAIDPTSVPSSYYAPFSLQEFAAIAKYTGYVMAAFVDGDIIKNQIFANYQGGPITKHTVHDFLFNSTDPLLKLIYPNTPSAWVSSPLDNIQDQKTANATLHTDEIYTGVGDIDLVSSPITFEGEEKLNYNKKIQVSGSFAEQLPPSYLSKDTDAPVNIFTDEFARSLSFKKEVGGNFGGIPYYRYRINESNWEVNPDFYQTIPYLLNLTSIKGGAPAYLSRPRLKGIDVGYYYKAGITNLINDDEDLDVFADYEPRSGKAIHGRYSLQVNTYIQGTDGKNSTIYNKYSAFRADVVHPMFWGVNIIAATQDQVDILTKAYKVDSFRYAITVILIVVGGFLSLISGGLFVLDKMIDL
ncbi:hypothetical protein RB653_000016 [Dictyostelium firmibasis]|uniref:Lysosome membrane protein 2 n=1 Tax=Dictyostelium firmibasis TaxID=79012 RepID=A0AAN7TUN2_9MYCE